MLLSHFILASPYWEEGAPEDVVLSEEETAEIRCLAGGNPPPLISWSMNGIPLHGNKKPIKHIIQRKEYI